MFALMSRETASDWGWSLSLKDLKPAPKYQNQNVAHRREIHTRDIEGTENNEIE
jgi:hypothetical protein